MRLSEYNTKALGWEVSRTEQLGKSERRAWLVAITAVVITGLSWAALVLVMPLKETTPYVIRVDGTTGVPDIVNMMTLEKTSYDDVMDKYWLAQYVRARETYDWYTIQKDYSTVGMLSSQQVGAQYAALFQGKEALDKKYGNTMRFTVDVISIVPNGQGIGTVRFKKTTKRTDDDSSPGTITKWIATVAYEYLDPSTMAESQRLVNPFGFQVLSYRIDPELVEGP